MSIDTRSPLIIEAEEGRIDAVRALLKEGANANSADENGMTPLMWAARNGNIDVVELLLEAGADYQLKNDLNQTALLIADQTGNAAVSDVIKHHIANSVGQLIIQNGASWLNLEVDFDIVLLFGI
eukprot:TRINITY_DN4146_c0_g1_i1.p1 TRINITY_DN4146_c0_g1~~TRINITY_DN4146_c0_g1_i1.p1  ORF type:complete len:125 (+),score=33.06 TRINITY_DN4146_c0_g1_i1:203-577(+)